MRKARHLGTQSFENLDLGTGIGNVILATDDVGDLHVDIVNHRRQRVEEQAVRADQDGVRHRGRVDLGVTTGQIFPSDALAFQLEAPVRLASFSLVRRLLLVRQL